MYIDRQNYVILVGCVLGWCVGLLADGVTDMHLDIANKPAGANTVPIGNKQIINCYYELPKQQKDHSVVNISFKWTRTRTKDNVSTVIWKTSGEFLADEPGVSMLSYEGIYNRTIYGSQFTKDTHALTLVQVGKDDGGLYSCDVTAYLEHNDNKALENAHGSSKTPTNLTIGDSTATWTITVEGFPGPMKEGDKIDLTCIVPAKFAENKTLTYLWIKNGAPVNHARMGRTLFIVHANYDEHHGIWGCVVYEDDPQEGQGSNGSAITDARVPDADNAMSSAEKLTGVGVSGIVKNASAVQAPDKEAIGDAVEALTGVDAPTSVEELNAKNLLAAGKNVTKMQLPDGQKVLNTAGELTNIDAGKTLDELSNIQGPDENQVIGAISELTGVEAGNKDDVTNLLHGAAEQGLDEALNFGNGLGLGGMKEAVVGYIAPKNALTLNVSVKVTMTLLKRKERRRDRFKDLGAEMQKGFENMKNLWNHEAVSKNLSVIGGSVGAILIAGIGTVCVASTLFMRSKRKKHREKRRGSKVAPAPDDDGRRLSRPSS